MPEYRLTIDSRQARIIHEALDVWARLHAGQVDCILGIQQPGVKVDHTAVWDAIKAYKAAAFPTATADDFSRPGCREAVNLRRLIRSTVTRRERPIKPGELRTVDYDGPLAGWWETDYEARCNEA